MDSRTFLRGAVKGAVAGGLAMSLYSQDMLATAGAAEPVQRPNFVFILADDLGWGDLACYGNGKIQTPNLDRMAAEGIRFTNFYSNSPVCSPSRCAFMTGQFPARNKFHYALSTRAENTERHMPNYLDTKIPTITHLLKDGGYATGHFGKWHLGSAPADPNAPAPEAYGIDESATFISNGQPCFPKDYLPHQSSEIIIDHSIKFIEAHKDKPFYINVWLSDPHSILAPTDEQMSLYESESVKKQTKGRFTSATQTYYAVITNMDKQVGRLLAKLDELNLSENTIVIFTSDNGPSPLWGWDTSHSGAGSVGPFRGSKASIYEGGIRMPCIVKWKGKTPAGIVDNDTVWSAVDFLPTFCKLADVALPEGASLDGENAVDCLRGKTFNRSKPLMWEYRYHPWGRYIDSPPALAMRQGKWKLMLDHDGSNVELYDVAGRGPEVDNLADNNSKVVKKMSKKLLDWSNALPGAADVPADAGVYEYPWPKSVSSN